MVRSVLRWLDSPWAFELLPGLNKLGRNPTNDFRISDPSISGFHAELYVENDVVRVRDLGSTNGTFVDNVRVDEALLKPENILRLGNIRFGLDEVPVTPVCQVQVPDPPSQPVIPSLNLNPGCIYHPAERSAYRCENCRSGFCTRCITVVGQSKFGATTICPMCKGQCYPLPLQDPEKQKPGFLGRLTQTLRLPFSR